MPIPKPILTLVETALKRVHVDFNDKPTGATYAFRDTRIFMQQSLQYSAGVSVRLNVADHDEKILDFAYADQAFAFIALRMISETLGNPV